MNAAHKKGDKISLQAEPRTVFGKKLTPLRNEGKVPANIFGTGFTSTAISVDKKEFSLTFRNAGETQVIYLQVAKDELPVLVSDMHVHPVSGDTLHVDFKKIDLKQKTEAEVPLVFVGEAEAVAHKKGDLLHLLDAVTVEALPNDIPSEIEVDVTSLAEVDDAIKISDLRTSKDYVVLDDPEAIIAKIAEHKEEEIEPAAEVEGEEAAAEGGDAPADAPKDEQGGGDAADKGEKESAE